MSQALDGIEVESKMRRPKRDLMFLENFILANRPED